MKIHRLLILLIPVLFAAPASAQQQNNEDENRQYVSWGIASGVNITGCRYDLTTATNVPDKVQASPGFEAGAFLEYHITRKWSLQMWTSGKIERVRLEKSGESNYLTTYGMDITIPVVYRIDANKGQWMLSTGPFSHFVIFNSISGEGSIENPYSRTIGTDPRTGEPRFALNDFNAGLAIAVGYEFKSHWQTRLEFKWGITDLLNVDSHDLYVKPYTVSLHVAYHFQ
ncbi:MAG: PorT family protein [Bacteroidales bacterium]|nr:PorT family protein [Bacteroidales bacterium]